MAKLTKPFVRNNNTIHWWKTETSEFPQKAEIYYSCIFMREIWGKLQEKMLLNVFNGFFSQFL